MEVVVESPPRKSTAFTAETARKAAGLSIIARKAATQRRIDQANAIIQAPPAAAQDQVFQAQRLACVRAQLAKIDRMIAEEEDPQRLDRLASAQARLSVQEFALAGRPMPGSRRPGRETPSKRSGEIGPVE